MTKKIFIVNIDWSLLQLNQKPFLGLLKPWLALVGSTSRLSKIIVIMRSLLWCKKLSKLIVMFSLFMTSNKPLNTMRTHTLARLASRFMIPIKRKDFARQQHELCAALCYSFFVTFESFDICLSWEGFFRFFALCFVAVKISSVCARQQRKSSFLCSVFVFIWIIRPSELEE